MKTAAYRFRNINPRHTARPLLLTTFLLFCFVTSDTHHATLTSWQRIAAERRLLQSFGKIPLSFEMNQGQADSAVRYLCRGNGYSFYLLADEVVLSLAGSASTKENEQNPASARTSTTLTKNHSVIRMQLENANPEPRMSGLDQLPGKTQYFIGNDPTLWRTGITNFARVAYQDIYPGIDLIYYGNQNQIEHDFVVSPGADPDAIKIRIQGAEELATDDEGNVNLTTGTESVLLKKPYIYQQIENQKRTIPGQYAVLADNRTIGFKVGRYDTDRPLIIDPVLVYSTKLGAGLESAGRAIAVDNQGCAYVTGRTQDSNFPVTTGAFQSERGTGGTGYNQNYDAFVTKFNTDGSIVLYSTYLGGKNHDDEALGIAVDNQGNAFVTGVAWSTDFPTTSGAFQLQSNESRFDWFHGEVFVAKLNPTGTALLYSTYLGGEEGDCGTAIAVNAQGEAFVTGYTSSEHFPVTAGAFCTFNSEVELGDAFVAKLNTEGSRLIYSTLLGAKTSEELWLYGTAAGTGIAVDAEGNAFITGETGLLFPTTPGSYQSEGYCFVAKLNSSGSRLIYSTCLGSTGGSTSANKLRGIAIDNDGCAYVTGYNWSGDFPVTAGAFQASLGSEYIKDAVVTKLNSTGSGVLYSSYFGGNKNDQGTGIAVDNQGRIYIVGVTESDNLPIKDGFQSTLKGNNDAFVAIFDPSHTGEASLIYSTYLGGSNSEVDQGVVTMSSTDWYDDLIGDFFGIWSGGIAVDAMGNAYVTGFTNSEDFPTTEQAFQRERRFVAFVAKIGKPDTVKKIGIWQDITLKSKGSFSADSSKNLVTFGDCRAKIVKTTIDSLIVRVPTELDSAGTSLTEPDTKPKLLDLVARLVNSSGDTTIVYQESVRFIPPKYLLYDEVTRANPPIRQEVFLLPGPRWRQVFNFIGQSTDGMAAVRVLNTSVGTPPLTLLVKVEAPNRELFDKNVDPTIGNLINIGLCNAGVQFPVTQDGTYRIIVEAADSSRRSLPIRSWGPFPALFQIHLAGNTGLPRKLINGVPEPARSIRLDTYFNHPAPRTETLERQFVEDETFAETGLFKFANPVSVNRSPIAVLIPPVGGFSPKNPPVRTGGPTVIGLNGLDPSLPQARTAGAENPIRGTVIDIAQIPIPASVVLPGPPPGVAAILGAKNGSSVTLPYKGIDTLICDMGSGNEIVDGAGKDFQVIAASGIYSVAVSNTPFNDTFVSLGSGMAAKSFDLASTGLAFARYVRISGSTAIDAIESINYFADRVDPSIGALEDVGSATITMRRQKSPVENLDPYLELIGPDGSALSKDDSGFGDDTDMTHSDAALINIPLTQQGFHRFLGRGYDTQPDENSFGTFYTRLETGGVYDQVELAVSSANEEQTQAQKKGIMNRGPRQRDSYLFQAQPGTTVNIVVNGAGLGQTPALQDPLVELYDPEDFVIAANDDYPGRGKNAALQNVKLPQTGRAGGAFPNPSTYRIVVCGMDVPGAATGASDGGTAYIRTAASGAYEVKVFTGSLFPGSAFKPIVSAVSPAEATVGATGVTLQVYGSNFQAGAILSFNDQGISVRSGAILGFNQITAVIDISADAAVGKKSVSVTNQNGLAGSGPDLFEIKSGLGTARLSWQAPAGNALLAPPADLNLLFDGSVSKRAEIFSSDQTTGRYGQSQKWDWTIDPSLQIIIDEVEPNNDACTAQELAGDTVLVVNGVVGYHDYYADVNKDDMDFYKVTTTGVGMSLQLSGLVSDCDLYLMRYRYIDNCYSTETVATAKTQNDSATEKITVPDLQPGMYAILVMYVAKIPPSQPTPYQLTVKGQFAGGVIGPVQSYNVYRSTVAYARSTGEKIASVPATQTEYADPLPHTGQFYYQVTAVYSAQESEPSNEVETLATHIEEQVKESPASFALLQNYPNPFNAETTILFDTAEPALVEIVIYNNLGQVVRRLVDGPIQAGVHKVTLDATDLVSGLYFCRMQAGSFVQMKKLLLLR